MHRLNKKEKMRPALRCHRCCPVWDTGSTTRCAETPVLRAGFHAEWHSQLSLFCQYTGMISRLREEIAEAIKLHEPESCTPAQRRGLCD